MLGRYFPHFRVVNTAFHVLEREWEGGQECRWEEERVRALRCFQNWTPLYVKEESHLDKLGNIELSGVF